jgi:hypothetical protein
MKPYDQNSRNKYKNGIQFHFCIKTKVTIQPIKKRLLDFISSSVFVKNATAIFRKMYREHNIYRLLDTINNIKAVALML